MIRFENVYKSFGNKHILNGLNLEVQNSEVFFILGRSGTGKSVALKHLVGLLKADSGKIWVDQDEISHYNESEFQRIRQKCGLVFQLPALVDSRNLYENLVLGIRHMPSSQKKQKLEWALHAVRLERLLPTLFDRYPPSLSYGEQKRLALARTLLPEPQILLYDEPTTGLDPKTSIQIHELIKSISRNEGKTSIVVSHDMKNALATADKVAVLDAGKVVDSGSPQYILQSKIELTRAFLEDLRA